jgi:hypothetical protein
MLTMNNEHYFTKYEARDFLQVNNQHWLNNYTKVPFVLIKEKPYFKISDMERIKELLDPLKYYSESRMCVETQLHPRTFRAHIREFHIPVFVHPFRKRVIYRASDVEVIRRERYG